LARCEDIEHVYVVVCKNVEVGFCEKLVKLCVQAVKQQKCFINTKLSQGRNLCKEFSFHYR
jgi:hypothetical protein